jgi:hydrogenase maturation protease
VIDLPLYWGPDDRVVVIDAAAPAGHPGRITDVDASTHGLVTPSAASTHAVDVGVAIELARALERMPSELSVVGIEGASFGFGDDLNPAVRRAAIAVTEQIRRRAARRG